MFDQENELYNLIVEYGIATPGELDLVTDISGYDMETLNAVIFSRTGYHDIEQFIEAEG